MADKKGESFVLVLCTLFALVVIVSSQQCATDDDDGTIYWGALPKLGTFKSNLDYQSDDQRRGTLSDMARGFVNLVTPPAAVSDLLDHLADVIEKVVDNTYVLIAWQEFQTVAAILVGIMVCLSVGVAYFVLVLLVGMIFGCCRCCNKCGGKRVQEESRCPGCLRVFYTVFLLCITGVLCAGMAYTNFSNDFIGYAYTKTEPAALDVLSDAQTFTTGTLKQMEYITNEQYGEVDCLIRRDVDNVGNEIAGPVVEYLKTDAGVKEAMDAFSNLISDLNDTYVALEIIDSSRAQVIDGTNSVKDLLTAVKQQYDALGPCPSCPDSTNLADVTDYSGLSTVDVKLVEAQSAKELAERLYTDLNNVLNNISTEIDKSAQPAVEDVKTLLDDTKQTVEESFKAISDAINQFNSTVLDAQNAINDWFDIVDQYSDYRYYGLIGVTCLTLLIVLFNVIGVTMGTFAYKDVLPTERSRMSNAGGNVLIAGVFFSIIFGPILMLICFLMFAVAGTATLTCNPLMTLEIFEKTIDKPDYIVPGYYLSNALLGNSSVELTVSSVLEDCKQDAAIYPTLKLSQLFSLDDIEKTLDEAMVDVLNELRKEINIPTLDLIPDNFEEDLNDAVSDINLGSIDSSFIQITLNKSVTETNLLKFAQEVRDASSDSSNSAIASNLTAIADELERIQTEEVKVVDDQKDLLLANALKLDNLNATLSASISTTVDKSIAAEDKVNLPSTDKKAQNVTVEYVDKVFGYADQYVSHVTKQLEEDVAKCLPVRNAYDDGVELACYYIFDSLNTLWFTTGWCAIFILPSIFISVRLAKYYRIMDEEALPKVKKSKRGRRSDQEMAMEDMSEDGHHTGHDNIRLVESLGQGGMQPQQNPHYIPDDVINGYDGYNNLGRPMAPPPAYHPEDDMRENKRTLIRAMLRGVPPQRSLEQSLENDDPNMGPSTSAGITSPSLSTGLSLPPYSRNPSFENAPEAYQLSPRHRRRLAAMMMYQRSRSSSLHASRDDSGWPRQRSTMAVPMSYPYWGRQQSVEYDEDRNSSFLSPGSFDRAAISQQSSFEDAFPVIIPGPYPLSERSSPFCQPDPLFTPPHPSVFCTLSPSMTYPPAAQPTHLYISRAQPVAPESPQYVNTQVPANSPAHQAPDPAPRPQPPLPPQQPPAPLPPILISPGMLRRQHQRVVFRQPTQSPPPSPPLPPPLPSSTQSLPQPDLLPPSTTRPRPKKGLQRQAAVASPSAYPSTPASSSSSSQAVPPVPPPRTTASLSTISGRSPASGRSPVPVPPPRIQIQRQASQTRDPSDGFNQHDMSPVHDHFRHAYSQDHLQRQNQHDMPPVNDPYRYGYSQDPLQRQNRESVMRDMQEYNKKPRVATYL